MKEAQIVDSVAVNDGLGNLVTSMGTTRDAAMYSTFDVILMSQSEYDNCYRNWIMRKCIDIPVNDAFRKDRFITIADKDQDAIKRFYDLEILLDIKSKFVEAAKIGRLYGGAVLLIGTTDIDWKLPITERSEITHLVVLSRYDITNVELDTESVLKPTYRKPKSYMIDSVPVHASRCIQFDGDLLPFSDYQSNQNWHGSIAQRLIDSVKPAQSVIQNFDTLINQLSTDVFKTPGFMKKLASLGEESAMIKRFQTAAFMRSNLNMMILDSEEEYVRQTATLTGVADTMLGFLHLVAGSADIPFTRFLGDSASGLNSTGAGDQQNYYDHVAADQNIIYAPRYAKIDPLLCNMVWGKVPDGFVSAFEPLWEMNDSEKAELQLKRAQRDTAYLTNMVLSPDIIARQLQSEETYSIDDEYIEALESYKEPAPITE